MDRLKRALDTRADTGRPVRLWLRDDDAVEPGDALDRLFRLARNRVPLTLAVIPERTDASLAAAVAREPDVTVALHGWAHRNHAPFWQKAQELGDHRPVATVLAELGTGKDRLAALHGPRFVPVLVPPWNRIAASVAAGLPDLGLAALSVFGPERPGALPEINTHVDLIDWRGTRGGKPVDLLEAQVLAALDRQGTIGLLTHHLVHDGAAWAFLDQLFALTCGHPGCVWVPVTALVP